VYDWRARHSMVGWVEYLMVRADAPDDVLILAANIVKSVADYPFLNEDAYQQEQLEAIHDFWKGLSERSRYDYAKDIGMSCPGGEDLVLDPDDCPEVMIEFFMEGDEFR